MTASHPSGSHGADGVLSPHVNPVLTAAHRSAGHSRFVQRVRRRYANELGDLPPGTPRRDTMRTGLKTLLGRGLAMPAALRVLPPLLYGADHAYAIPFSGTGTEASIASLTRDDLVAFHKAWVRPEGTTLVVVGDTTLKAIVPLLEKHLGDWKGEGAAPAVALPSAVQRPAQPRVFLIDQPGSVQANILLTKSGITAAYIPFGSCLGPNILK